MIGKLAPLLTQGLFPKARLMESAGEIKLNLWHVAMITLNFGRKVKV